MSIATEDLIQAQVTDSGLNQPIIRFANLSIIHRAPEHGGGVLLSVEWSRQRIQFVMNEEARLALLEKLSKPGHPVTAPGNFCL